MPTGNTGMLAYAKLKKVTNDGTDRPLDANNNLVSVTGLPQYIKDNIVGQADYIAPIQDLVTCPLPPPQPTIQFSNVASFGVSPTSGNPVTQTSSGTITITGASYRIDAYATIYTYNSTSININAMVNGIAMYSERNSSYGTTTSGNHVDLPPGTYNYSITVSASGVGGSGNAGLGSVQI